MYPNLFLRLCCQKCGQEIDFLPYFDGKDYKISDRSIIESGWEIKSCTVLCPGCCSKKEKNRCR